MKVGYSLKLDHLNDRDSKTNAVIDGIEDGKDCRSESLANFNRGEGSIILGGGMKYSDLESSRDTAYLKVSKDSQYQLYYQFLFLFVFL